MALAGASAGKPGDGAGGDEEAEHDALAAWLALSLLEKRRDEICTREASYLSCIEAWKREEARHLDGELGGLLDGVPERARQSVREVLRARAENRIWSRYLPRRARAAAVLVAIERALRSLEPGASCPAPPRSVVLGEPLAAEESEGEVRLFAPSWLQREGEDRLELIRFQCAAP